MLCDAAVESGGIGLTGWDTIYGLRMGLKQPDNDRFRDVSGGTRSTGDTPGGGVPKLRTETKLSHNLGWTVFGMAGRIVVSTSGERSRLWLLRR